MRTKIVRMGINGEGIGYQDRKPIFLPGALVDEEVEYTIVEKKPTYYIGKIGKIIKKSENRIQPKCKIQHRCDGCPLMILDYKSQLEYKFNNLVQTLNKYTRIDKRVIEEVVANPNPLHYRNQCKLPLMMENGKLVNGMFLQNSNYIIPIEHCCIHEFGVENVRKKILEILNKHSIKAYDNKTKKGLRYLVVRGIGEKYQCTLVSGDDTFSKELISELSAISNLVSIYQSVQTTKNTPNIFGKKMIQLSGSKYLSFELDDIQLRLSAQSFFQLNTIQAKTMYRLIKTLVPKDSNLILEAYSGVGGISLYLKDMAKQIKGVEFIESAVINAKQNTKLNNAEHVKFEVGDASEKMATWCKKNSADVIIVDPPRSGLDDGMLDSIIRSKAKNVIYISCNPSTLAKNLDMLQSKYKVKRIIPIDIFSQTQHVESVTLLSR